VSVGLGDDENIFKWELMIIGPPDTLYEGGFFNCKLEFPNDFPNSPPVMTFFKSYVASEWYHFRINHFIFIAFG
jgi:ubiquitin-protein ligase